MIKLVDILNEGPGRSAHFHKMLHRKAMKARYFMSDENGKIIKTGLKTMSSVRAVYNDRNDGYIGGSEPKVVNVHDLKNNGEVVEQYFWKGTAGVDRKGRSGIDIDNPTSSNRKPNKKYIKMDKVDKYLEDLVK